MADTLPVLSPAPVVAPSAPALCVVGNKLRRRYYRATGEDRGRWKRAYQDHCYFCPDCLAHFEYMDKLAKHAVHPELTAEQIENA